MSRCSHVLLFASLITVMSALTLANPASAQPAPA